MAKLSAITEEVKKFLSLVGRDAHIQHDSKDWLALKFENHSVYFDCLLDQVEEANASDAKYILKTIMGRSLSPVDNRGRIHPKTEMQYVRISECIESNEVIGFGIYENGEDEPSLRYELSKTDGIAIAESIAQQATYHGEVQGWVHAFYKEAKKPKMIVRELASGELVDCFFKPELYAAAVEVLTEREGVVFVEGEVTENLIEGKIESIQATDFKPAALFDLDFFHSFIGSVPNFTGDQTSEDFISEDE